MVKVKGFIAVKERVGVFVCFVKMRTKIKKIVSKHCFFLPPHMATEWGNVLHEAQRGREYSTLQITMIYTLQTAEPEQSCETARFRSEIGIK